MATIQITVVSGVAVQNRVSDQPTQIVCGQLTALIYDHEIP